MKFIPVGLVKGSSLWPDPTWAPSIREELVAAIGRPVGGRRVGMIKPYDRNVYRFRDCGAVMPHGFLIQADLTGRFWTGLWEMQMLWGLVEEVALLMGVPEDALRIALHGSGAELRDDGSLLVRERYSHMFTPVQDSVTNEGYVAGLRAYETLTNTAEEVWRRAYHEALSYTVGASLKEGKA